MSVTLSYTMTNADAQRAVDAICARYGYDMPGANPDGLTRAVFARKAIKSKIIEWVLEYEQSDAAQTAKDSVTAIDVTDA